MEDLIIRPVTPADAAGLLGVYAPFVTDTAISFEEIVPTEAEFRARIQKTTAFYPYFAAVRGDTIVGYAYAGAFVGRAAYRWDAEMTIYLSPSEQKRGTGRKLYAAMEEALGRMGIQNLYACIGLPETPDEYLNNNSAEFHRHMGYRLVGTFLNCGRKFGRWYHMIWMEKLIGDHGAAPAEVRPWPETIKS